MNKKIFLANENKWLATDRTYKKIFAASENLNSLQKKLKKLSVKNAVTLFVPPFDKVLSPKCQ